jgi:hypothetical protein
MNAARLTKSDRLARVSQVLADGQPHSTLDIIQAARVCAVNSAVAELRQNGQQIECRREGDVWFYRRVL